MAVFLIRTIMIGRKETVERLKQQLILVRFPHSFCCCIMEEEVIGLMIKERSACFWVEANIRGDGGGGGVTGEVIGLVN